MEFEGIGRVTPLRFKVIEPVTLENELSLPLRRFAVCLFQHDWTFWAPKLTPAHSSALHFSPFKWNVSDLIDFRLDLSLHLYSATSINLAGMQRESYWFLYPLKSLRKRIHTLLSLYQNNFISPKWFPIFAISQTHLIQGEHYCGGGKLNMDRLQPSQWDFKI